MRSEAAFSAKYMKSGIDALRSSFYCDRMASETRKLEKQARDLAPKDRARLALKLIESLDPGTDEDAEELWLDEAERRLSDYAAGKTEARLVDEVISEIEQKLG